MCFSKKGYFSNKALLYSLDLLYDHQSNIRINLKNTYIVVDFDKTLIIKDALLKLIFICFLSNGFKFKNSDSAWNRSGGIYFYMAFAEQAGQSPYHIDTNAR